MFANAAATAPYTVPFLIPPFHPAHLHVDAPCSKAADLWAIHLQPSPGGARGPSQGDVRMTHFLNVTSPRDLLATLWLNFPIENKPTDSNSLCLKGKKKEGEKLRQKIFLKLSFIPTTPALPR